MKELFSFKGRIGRLSYLWHSTGDTIILIFAAMLAPLIPGSNLFNESTSAISLILLVLFIFAGAIIELAATVKRFHDIGKSGWSIFAMMIPIYNFFLALQLLFQAGQPVVNDYGKPLD